MDNQETNLLEGWKKLTEKNKEEFMFYLQFLLEEQEPSYQKRIAKENKEFDHQMAKMDNFQNRLSKVAMDTRAVLYDNLPKNIRDLLLDFELLNFYTFTAEYKPFYMLKEDQKCKKVAERTARRVTARFVRMNIKPA